MTELQQAPTLAASIAEEKAEKDASNTAFIPEARYTPPAAQRTSHVVHARASPQQSKGVKLDVKLQPKEDSEENSHGQPNNFNPIGAQVPGVASPPDSSATVPTSPTSIAGENRAPATVDQGAIVHEINDQDLNNTKRHMDSELQAKEQARQAL